MAYVTEQLQAWKAGTRPPGHLGLMPAVASKLSDKDVDAVAAYYAALATVPAQAPVQGTGKAVQNNTKGARP
ncbi:hypothetical protein CF68_31675 [Cupriavidus sp. SK-4]|uniref:hypothetical protein n=1 Tax=Cupriavidus sp. SK-4 TaxID=574750 RepID=UPI00044CC49E|nr:hypothetical protein CF68_31675 [Cupriavidus sp. SK-4]